LALRFREYSVIFAPRYFQPINTMTTLLRIAVLFALLPYPNWLSAQSFKEDIKKIQEAYKTGAVVHQLKYQFKENSMKGRIVEQRQGWFRAMDGNSFFKLGHMLMLKQDSLMLMVDKQSQTIMLAVQENKIATDNPMGTIEQAMEICDSISPIKNPADETRGYRFWFSNTEMQQVDVTFSPNTYLLETVSMLYAATMPVEDKSFTPFVHIIYQTSDALPKDIAAKSEWSNYIILKEGVHSPAPAYTEYDFINQIVY